MTFWEEKETNSKLPHPEKQQGQAAGRCRGRESLWVPAKKPGEGPGPHRPKSAGAKPRTAGRDGPCAGRGRPAATASSRSEGRAPSRTSLPAPGLARMGAGGGAEIEGRAGGGAGRRGDQLLVPRPSRVVTSPRSTARRRHAEGGAVAGLPRPGVEIGADGQLRDGPPGPARQ